MDENTAQLELEKSQKLLKAIFEGITDPMIVLDRKMNLKLVNNAAIKYFGISPRTSLDNIPCYKALMGKDKVCSDCRIKDALFKQENLCYERDGFINPDRREQITLCPAVDHGSGSTYASIRINDITDFREIETELTHADKMISLGMLLSGMAHEINNPTNYILLNSQLLLKSWKSIFPILETYFKNNGEFSVAGLPYGEMRIEIPDLLSGIEQSAKRIKQIIIDLKTFSRKDDLKANEYINVNEAIEDSVRL
ncbi:MAG: histidine kinase dimerization/phospho-acceptor domain-containing protein, partial [Desulfobacteraceae bacterium]